MSALAPADNALALVSARPSRRRRCLDVLGEVPREEHAHAQHEGDPAALISP
jgi:hypothetical protein